MATSNAFSELKEAVNDHERIVKKFQAALALACKNPSHIKHINRILERATEALQKDTEKVKEKEKEKKKAKETKDPDAVPKPKRKRAPKKSVEKEDDEDEEEEFTSEPSRDNPVKMTSAANVKKAKASGRAAPRGTCDTGDEEAEKPKAKSAKKKATVTKAKGANGKAEEATAWLDFDDHGPAY